jgi:hypothetical protein
MDSHAIRSHLFSSFLALLGVAAPGASWADGILLPPILPGGLSPTIWESMQEAIIIHDLETLHSRAVEDLIVKLSVQSLEDVETFNWVIPFPNPPETSLENPKVFEEIRRHVTEHGQEDGQRRPQEQTMEKREGETREGETPEGAGRQGGGEAKVSAAPRAQEAAAGALHAAPQDASRVRVISRKTVGSYDVAIVRALEKGALDAWLEKEGFRSREHEGKDVVEFYRQKGYVFACVKVSDVKLAKGRTLELPPLRFTFETGGRDGVYFPMKMTSLQKEPFDLELHIFSPKPIDENASQYGYAHRGLRGLYREGNEDGDAPKEGRSWSALESDRFLKRDASHLPSLAELFRRVRPGGEHYLTSIGTRGMRPQALESWRDDLWVFPRYPEADFVPFDARPGGPAAAGWAKAGPPKGETASRSEGDARKQDSSEAYPLSGLPTRHVDIEAKEHDSGP